MTDAQSSFLHADLVASLRADDERALEVAYHMWHPALWRFAYRLVRSADVADDLVQETFVTFWERRANLEITQNLQTYLFGILRHRAIDLLRRDTKLRAIVQAEYANGTPLASGSSVSHADDAMDFTAMQVTLEQGLAALPEMRRTALLLRWELNMPYDDIAAILGATPAAARQLVTRARDTLRDKLTRFF